MINSGFPDITCNTLSASSRYKVLKFKSVLSKALESIQGIEKSLLEASNIQDMKELESDIKKLEDNKSRTSEEDEKYQNLINKRKQYLDVRTEMLNDDITLADIDTISYEDWYLLRKENRPKDSNEIITNYIEDALKGVLWVEPDE